MDGDLRDPVQLRRIRELAERIEVLEHVARVQHIGQPVGLLNEMMEGQARIPRQPTEGGVLDGLPHGKPAVRQLANEGRTAR